MNLSLRHFASALAFMTLGTAVVFGLMVAMNELTQPPRADTAERQVSFEVIEPPEPEPKKIVRRQPRQPPPRNPTPPPPMAHLTSSIGTVDIPIPGLDLSAIGAASREALASGRDLTMTAETVDTPPRPLARSAVRYPPAAKASGTEGYVVVRMLIGKNGNVREVHVLEARPDGVFEQAAVKAVRQWRFTPARYQNEAVRVWARQKIRFNLS